MCSRVFAGTKCLSFALIPYDLLIFTALFSIRFFQLRLQSTRTRPMENQCRLSFKSTQTCLCTKNVRKKSFHVLILQRMFHQPWRNYGFPKHWVNITFLSQRPLWISLSSSYFFLSIAQIGPCFQGPIHGYTFIMIRLDSLWYNCIYWSRFETLSIKFCNFSPVIIRLACTKANSYSNFVLTGHLQLTCVEIFEGYNASSPLDAYSYKSSWFDSFFRLTTLATICCRFVLQPRSPFALDPRPRTRATCWIVVAFMSALRRVPGWVVTIFWETLFTLSPWPVIEHPTISPYARSVFSYP